jgi:hypothetical protein
MGYPKPLAEYALRLPCNQSEVTSASGRGEAARLKRQMKELLQEQRRTKRQQQYHTELLRHRDTRYSHHEFRISRMERHSHRNFQRTPPGLTPRAPLATPPLRPPATPAGKASPPQLTKTECVMQHDVQRACAWLAAGGALPRSLAAATA